MNNSATTQQFRSPTNKYLITIGNSTVFISGPWPMGRRICYRANNDPNFLYAGDLSRVRRVSPEKLAQIKRIVLAILKKN